MGLLGDSMKPRTTRWEQNMRGCRTGPSRFTKTKAIKLKHCSPPTMSPGEGGVPLRWEKAHSVL